MAITLDPPEVATRTPSRSPKALARAPVSGGCSGSSPRCSSAPAPCTSRSAPSHFGESTVEGVGFLVAAWLQIAAGGRSAAPADSRGHLHGDRSERGLASRAWAVSRIWGLPFGQHADHAEQVTVVDGTDGGDGGVHRRARRDTALGFRAPVPLARLRADRGRRRARTHVRAACGAGTRDRRCCCAR